MKVGDYVRTEDGRIGKIISKGEIKGLYFKTEPYVILDIDENKKEDCIRTLLNEIVKSSPNIIDLIEEGDYVNGFKVVWKDNNEFCINAYNEEEKIIRKEQKIKSIVTKEQFESMKYKIGE